MRCVGKAAGPVAVLGIGICLVLSNAQASFYLPHSTPAPDVQRAAFEGATFEPITYTQFFTPGSQLKPNMQLMVIPGLTPQSVAYTPFHGLLPKVKSKVARIAFDAPALAPIAYTRFCMKYTDDCKVRRMAFRRPGIVMTQARWAELVSVNGMINKSIAPEEHVGDVIGLNWSLYPKSGDCKEYASTKRHELLGRGWPSRALLLAEVIIRSGEHHMVLVVRTLAGDFVLDNLNKDIRPWTSAPYQWVRIQSPSHPLFWSTIRVAPTV
jgi:predicted transglutaminase-like cysteine proteinase